MTSVLDAVVLPPGWEFVPFGRLVERSREAGRPDLPPLSVFLDEGVVPRTAREDNFNRLGADMTKYLVVRPGDVVFNKLRTWQGGLGVSCYEGVVSPAYYVCRPTSRAEPRFLHHLLRSAPYLAELTRASKFMPPSQFDILWDDLSVVPISTPPIDVQRKIADYLDTETARIDALIYKKHRLLDVLAERQQTVIIAAMSGVLATMHDDEAGFKRRISGSEHRDKRLTGQRPLRAYADVQLGRQRTPDHDTGPHMTMYLRAANVQDGRLDVSDVKSMNFEPEEQRQFSLRTGDVLISEGSGSLASIGATAVWNDEIDGTVCFQNTLLRLRPRESTDPRFLAWWCRYAYTSGLFAGVATGANIYHLSADRVRSLPMKHVPLTIQRTIADHLDTEIGRLDTTLDRERRVLELLAERRQALITTAVTGEMQVPST